MATIPANVRDDRLYKHSTGYVNNPVHRIAQQFDAAAATALKGSALAAGDVVQLLNVPAGTFVHSVSVNVVTVEGSAFTFTIGDTAAPASYGAAINGATLTKYTSANGTTTPANGVGKLYTAADTINLVISTGVPVGALIWVSAICFDVLNV